MMYCPKCEHPTIDTLDTRQVPYLNRTRRRKQCRKCKNRFTTNEILTTELTGIRLLADIHTELKILSKMLGTSKIIDILEDNEFAEDRE